MNVDVVKLLQELDAIELDMRRLESRLTTIRERLHGGRLDVDAAGWTPKQREDAARMVRSL